jgi:fructuronate reductase
VTDTTTITTRFVRDAPAPPVRIVHLGLGAFARSHTAWYTARAADAADWGIAAYAGRTRALADTLASQDGLYTLIERGPDRDRAELIGSLARTHAAADVSSLLEDLAAPTTALVTLTLTEAGYLLRPDGSLDVSAAEVVTDLAKLRAVAAHGVDLELAAPVTALARLVLGLECRRRRCGVSITLLSCDNLPDNGGVLRRGVTALAGVFPGLTEWIDGAVSFASSSVDRITPRLSARDAADLHAALGDLAPVVAEPFADWVIAGAFPSGRPAWETAGARFVDDLEPWEARKLWMLNGAHTLLASLGLLRGHLTVSDAIADPTCRRAVDDLWDEAVRGLPSGLDLEAYRAALVDRFSNARISHALTQIGTDTPTKLRLRIAPVAVKERAAGRPALGCAAAFAAWIVASREGLLAPRFREGSVRDLVARIDSTLAADDDFVQHVELAAESLSGHDTPARERD